MVKLTLTFKQLVALVKTELQDNFPEFEQTFISKIATHCDLMQMRPPAPIDYSLALLECTSILTFSLSPTIKKLVQDFHDIASTFIIPNKRALDPQTSPKATPKVNQKIPDNLKRSEHSVSQGKTSTKSPLRVDSTQLSAKKTKIFKKFIEDQKSNDCKLYSSCKTSPCKEVCPKIVRIAPLTACTHPKPHPGGYYPHVSRKIVRKVHQSGEYTAILTMRGIPNPLNEQSSVAGTSENEVVMKELSEKNPAIASSASKKRKLDEISDSKWSWVGNTLRANSKFEVVQKMTFLLQTLDAPDELRKSVLKWNTLSEADRMRL